MPCRSQFEVDFINLSYCNREEDLYAARAYLDGVGLHQTKLIAKVGLRGRARAGGWPVAWLAAGRA